MTFVKPITLLFVFFCSNIALAQNSFVNIADLRSDDLRKEVFILNSDAEIVISANTFYERSFERDNNFAWIINAETREIVWDLKDSDFVDRTRIFAEFEDKVKLDKGIYEVYVTTISGAFMKIKSLGDVGSIIGRAFSNITDNNDRRRRDYDKLFLRISGNGKLAEDNLTSPYRENVVVDLTNLGDDEFRVKGFAVEKDIELDIYAIGEESDGDLYDYGYIINALTRKKVWDMSDDYLDYAGGAEKNVMIREKLKLKKGKYAAFFITDDSHSADEWNQPPPYDPEFWGMSVRTTNSEDFKFVKEFDYEELENKNVIASIVKVRDSEYLSEGFTLNRDMDLRIYALGEGVGYDMSDFSWIIDVETGKKVWEMNYRDTEHAGGNKKNRAFDDIISLKKGNYLVYTISDGSHSYGGFNAKAPINAYQWGITIYSAEDNFNKNDVSNYDPESAKNVLVKMIRFRNNDFDEKILKLAEKTKIRIYAIGEGDIGEMNDYGWIENNNTGRIVWEMRFRDTEHAGGHRKNRSFNGMIELEAGEYTVGYETDGSHSYKSWNSKAPLDRNNWGITIFKVDK